MSKNISIAEGGVARQFTNDKLKINLVGGGTEYFVPESGVQLGTKSITQNGTYAAASDGKYGYSQVTVNIRGGNGSAGSDGKPNTSGTGPLPGGAGSAVVGTDPTTGNDYAVGVDEDGELVTTPVPSAIQIITPPAKTSYTAGETMDYTGIVVAAKKRDGTTFTDARYTNGHIPMGELIFPVEKAPAASGNSGEITDGNGINAIIGTANGDSILRHNAKRVDIYPRICITSSSTIKLTYYNGDIFAAQYSGEVGFTADSSGVSSAGGWEYFSSGDTFKRLYSWPRLDLPESTVDPTGVDVNTLHGVTATIPVQWLNPYTGETHRDAFDITSTQSSGSGGTTVDNEGVSGTEGGF